MHRPALSSLVVLFLSTMSGTWAFEVSSSFLSTTQRSLATTSRKKKQTSQTANAALENYVENVDVNTFNPNNFGADDEPRDMATDWALACGNEDDIEVKLFGAATAAAEVNWCTCEANANPPVVVCSVSAPTCTTTEGEDTAFSGATTTTTSNTLLCTQDYQMFFFEASTGQFAFKNFCTLCESGNCDGQLFENWCLAVLYQTRDVAPTACQIGFASDNYSPHPECAAYTGCQICQIAGSYYYGASSTNCALTSAGQCWGGATFASPFPQLRADFQAEQEKSSNVGAIVGSVVGILIFVAVGAAIYYYYFIYHPDEDSDDGKTTPHKTRGGGSSSDANVGGAQGEMDTVAADETVRSHTG